MVIADNPSMAFRVPPADRKEVVWASRINLKAFRPAVGTKLHAFPPVSIRKTDLAEHAPFDEKGRALNKGSIPVSHIAVTEQKLFLIAQIHIVGSFSRNIGFFLEQGAHAFG